jgi:DNA-binding CsgD family transcriptional regulator
LRERGGVWSLMTLLAALSMNEYVLGRWSSAVAHLTEGISVARQTGHKPQTMILQSLLARVFAARGEATKCRELARELLASELDHWVVINFTHWALGLLALGEGRPEEAFGHLSALAPIETWPNRTHVALRATGDLAEAAISSGRPEAAARALEGLERWGNPKPPPWVLVILHRGRGMLACAPESAGEHFRAAISVPGGTLRPWEQARTQLLYGEWLHRQRIRTEARQQLRAALEVFDRLGASMWSKRARSELRATGERIRKPTINPLDRLTPQELQIARLAALKLTNSQIGAQLFLSPRTVGTHLYRLFPKLGIVSRSDLREINLDDVQSLTSSSVGN